MRINMQPGSIAFLVLSITVTLSASGVPPWRHAVNLAENAHGEAGRRAAAFLSDYHATRDEALAPEILDQAIEYALKAREEFPWARKLSEERFFNDVLPYASLDETRELWREKLYNLCKPMVADCKTTSEAAHIINQKLFDAVNVHYNTGRKEPNQSPAESIAQGKATCTGLSILLVDACRSVGIPARIAGVANWKTVEGNHTWVEIWDEDGWHFLGADEPDSRGLDHAWFEDRAAQAVPGDPKYAIWATSFQPTGNHFPMVWNLEDKSVPAVDVTERYLKPALPEMDHTWSFRLLDQPGGERLWASVMVTNKSTGVVGRFSTRAGTCDLNDMPQIELRDGRAYEITLMHNGCVRRSKLELTNRGSRTVDLHWSECKPALFDTADFAPLSEVAAEALVNGEMTKTLGAMLGQSRQSELNQKCFEVGDKKLKFEERRFGQQPDGGYSLWISLHGGGGAPAKVNDQQWKNQIKLYEPKEGIYIAPRAPTDTWNLWHQTHVDELLGRLIETYVATQNVNPNRVYLLGYSAGGDGVFQLAPRMADRFAAASMMAGHPNEAKPLGLRNLPFAILMGGDDGAYDRNKVAQSWGDKLAALQKDDPQGYPHRVTIYPGLGHWMEGRDKEVLPWMAAQTRNPWPKRVVWYQDDVTHKRLYWLEVEEGDAKKGTTIRADVTGQTIAITSNDVSKVTLRLRDALIDLDKPITVTANGKAVYQGHVARTTYAVQQSLFQRHDAPAAATAMLTVDW